MPLSLHTFRLFPLYVVIRMSHVWGLCPTGWRGLGRAIRSRRKERLVLTVATIQGGNGIDIHHASAEENKVSVIKCLELLSFSYLFLCPVLNRVAISSNVLFLVSGTFLYVKIQKIARKTLNGKNV